jgi:hypothetical protein
MDDSEFQTLLKLWGIFMPYATARRTELGRVVHYTSAENTIQIILSKTMWMRNTRCMADYREVEHGYEMLFEFFREPKRRDPFYKAFRGSSAGVGEEAVQLFNQWWNSIRFNTYIASISEHGRSVRRSAPGAERAGSGSPGGVISMSGQGLGLRVQKAANSTRSIGQENLTSPRISHTASLGYRRKGAEPWLLTVVASPSGSTADVANLTFARACPWLDRRAGTAARGPRRRCPEAVARRN